ncbi:MAG TPA: helix-turn-helix domain-containing protein [Blastocatellia bacterium]|nr:helix-turn-helix domain-containing protein [Blastocatellia bacterium]
MLGEERILEDLSLNDSGAEDAIYDDGYLRVEHDRFYVACAGKPLYNLTRKEFLILSRLVRAVGRPVTKQEIWGFAWKGDAEFNRDTLRVHVASLRRKLSPFGLDVVAVVHVGYRLMSLARRTVGFTEGDVP